MEGLGNAIHLARLTGDQKRLTHYQERTKMGYRWLFSLQYTEADTLGLKRTEMAIGGLRTSPPSHGYGLITHSILLVRSRKDCGSFSGYSRQYRQFP